MPGPLHQGLVHLLNNNPHLVFDLARHFDDNFPTSWAGFEAASNELPDPAAEGNILHADGVLAALAAVEWFRTGALTPEWLAATAVGVGIGLLALNIGWEQYREWRESPYRDVER